MTLRPLKLGIPTDYTPFDLFRDLLDKDFDDWQDAQEAIRKHLEKVDPDINEPWEHLEATIKHRKTWLIDMLTNPDHKEFANMYMVYGTVFIGPPATTMLPEERDIELGIKPKAPTEDAYRLLAQHLLKMGEHNAVNDPRWPAIQMRAATMELSAESFTEELFTDPVEVLAEVIEAIVKDHSDFSVKKFLSLDYRDIRYYLVAQSNRETEVATIFEIRERFSLLDIMRVNNLDIGEHVELDDESGIPGFIIRVDDAYEHYSKIVNLTRKSLNV